MRWTLAWLLALAAALVAHAAGAEAEIPTVPITFSVASDDGEPVRDAAWIDAQLAEALTMFAPWGVRFKRTSIAPLGADRAHVLTRADRDALAELVRPGVVNVFVVAGLADVDEKDRFRSGVHWRASSQPKTRYIVLAAAASRGVLAHELGHYFGNPHSSVPDNVMSYARTGAVPFFDVRQGAIIRSEARRVIATREIVAID
jgi:hypothetical protein